MRIPFSVPALIFVISSASAQDSDIVRLRELESASKPKQQTDLDTFKLASAHRERAESIQEKTNGLWQSWLVSICEGCGPERQPYFKRNSSQFSEKPARDVLVARSNLATMHKAVFLKTQRYKPTITIASDLSDSNIDRIRRTPSR